MENSSFGKEMKEEAVFISLIDFIIRKQLVFWLQDPFDAICLIFIVY